MPKLTKVNVDLLTALADDDGFIPTDRQAAAAAWLVRAGFVISVPESDRPSRLIITTKGVAALGRPTALGAEKIPPGPNQRKALQTALASPELEVPAAGLKAVKPDPTGMLGVLIGLLRRPEGAGMAELMAATAWQAHSVRGAIAGALKKKLGLAIVSEQADGGRRYRMAERLHG